MYIYKSRVWRLKIKPIDDKMAEGKKYVINISNIVIYNIVNRYAK